MAHFIYSSIFSRNSTGPDLSHFWYLKIKVFSQNIHRSGPVAHLIYSSIFSRNSTGPDLSHFWYLKIFFFLKNKVFYLKIFLSHRSGPVAHFIYSSIFSHNSTGPDLSHFWYLKIKVFLKIFTGPDLWHILFILAFFYFFVIPQVRTCRFWYLKIKVFSQNIHRSGPVAHFLAFFHKYRSNLSLFDI